MKVTITIDKDTILDDVKREAEYIGMKGGAYDALMQTDEDDELNSRVLADAVSAVSKTLRWYMTSATSNVLTLLMPNTFKETAGVEMQSEANLYCKEMVLAEWLRVCGSPQNEVALQKAQIHLQKVYALLNTREMPKRKNMDATVYPTVEISIE